MRELNGRPHRSSKFRYHTYEFFVFRINGEVSEAGGGRASNDVECQMRRAQHVDDDR